MSLSIIGVSRDVCLSYSLSIYTCIHLPFYILIYLSRSLVISLSLVVLLSFTLSPRI